MVGGMLQYSNPRRAIVATCDQSAVWRRVVRSFRSHNRSMPSSLLVARRPAGANAWVRIVPSCPWSTRGVLPQSCLAVAAARGETPVARKGESGDPASTPSGNGGDFLVQDLNGVAEFGLEDMADSPSVIDCRSKLADAVAIRVDPGADGVARTESIHGDYPRCAAGLEVRVSIERDDVLHLIAESARKESTGLHDGERLGSFDDRPAYGASVPPDK